MKDDTGNPYNLDVSGAPKKVVDRYNKFVRKVSPNTQRAIGRVLSNNARLSTKGNSNNTTNDVTKTVRGYPIPEMYADMEKIVLDHGGKYSDIKRDIDKETGKPFRYFEASDGTNITAREFSSDRKPTNQITVTRGGGTKHHLKIRYERAQK